MRPVIPCGSRTVAALLLRSDQDGQNQERGLQRDTACQKSEPNWHGLDMHSEHGKKKDAEGRLYAGCIQAVETEGE